MKLGQNWSKLSQMNVSNNRLQPKLGLNTVEQEFLMDFSFLWNLPETGGKLDRNSAEFRWVHLDQVPSAQTRPICFTWVYSSDRYFILGKFFRWMEVSLLLTFSHSRLTKFFTVDELKLLNFKFTNLRVIFQVRKNLILQLFIRSGC